MDLSLTIQQYFSKSSLFYFVVSSKCGMDLCDVAVLCHCGQTEHLTPFGLNKSIIICKFSSFHLDTLRHLIQTKIVRIKIRTVLSFFTVILVWRLENQVKHGWLELSRAAAGECSRTLHCDWKGDWPGLIWEKVIFNKINVNVFIDCQIWLYYLRKFLPQLQFQCWLMSSWGTYCKDLTSVHLSTSSAGLADCPLYLPHLGAGRSSWRGLGWWAVWLHL